MTLPIYMSKEYMERDAERPTKEQLEEYHNFLEEMMKDRAFWGKLDGPTRQAMFVCRDTLCFVLGHNNRSMEQNVQTWVNGYMRFKGINTTFLN